NRSFLGAPASLPASFEDRDLAGRDVGAPRGSRAGSEPIRTGGPLQRRPGPSVYSSAYLAFNIAEKRAALVFRRFLALGFSKRRWSRTWSMVCSRSNFFFSRRSALSTGSPFLSLISVIIPSSNTFDLI